MPVASFDIEIKGYSTTINNLAELEETLKGIKKGAKEIDFDSASLENYIKEQAKLTAEQKKFRAEVRDQVRAIEATEKSYKGLSAQLNIQRKNAKDLAVQFGRNSKEFKNAAADVRLLDKELKAIDAELGQFQRNVGNYPQVFQAAFSDIAGNIVPNFGGQLKSALEGIGVGEDLVGAFTNPLTIGLTAAAVVGGELFSFIQDTTKEYEKLFSEVSKTAGLIGDDLVTNTSRLSTISQVFEQDFSRILQSANNAAQGFDRGFGDVLDNIELGLLNIASGDAQDEFLDSFREYPQLIDNAGFSLEEFTRLAVASSKNGIFSDKLIDSIKEADISLKEFTQTQSDALSNVLGEEVTKQLEERIRTGELTTKDAILEIGNALEESGADFQDYATITADVFKGAGEDVGGFRDILEIVRSATEELPVPTDAYTQRLLIQRDATAELEFENARLAAAFAGTGQSIESLGKKFKAFGVDLLNDVVETFRVNSRILSEEGFFGALRGGATKFKEVADEIREEDAKALSEVQAGQSEAAKKERERQDAEVEAKRQQAARIRQINKALAEDEKAREEAAKFALENPEGSINLYKKQLQELKELFTQASTDSNRNAIADQIDEVTAAIQRAKEGGAREVFDIAGIDSGADVPDGIEQTSATNSELTQADQQRIANEQLLEAQREYAEQQKEIDDEIAANRLDVMTEVSDRLAEVDITNAEEVRDAILQTIFDQATAFIQTQIISAIAAEIGSKGLIGAVTGGIAAGLVRALLSRIRGAVFGEDGFELDKDGNVVGRRHSQGGEWSVINGRLTNVEAGENYQTGENGSKFIINRKSSRKYGQLLNIIRDKVFPGKNEVLSMINGGFPDEINVNRPFTFAQTGAQFAPVAAPASFIQKVELSDDSIDRMQSAVQQGARQGSNTGTRAGVQEATEQSLKLENLRTMTTY